MKGWGKTFNATNSWSGPICDWQDFLRPTTASEGVTRRAPNVASIGPMFVGVQDQWQTLVRVARSVTDSAAKSQSREDLEDWLGGRDSNPDCTVQSRVSYH